MQSIAVLIGIDRYRSDAQFVSAAKHADRNFAAICNKQFFDVLHRHSLAMQLRFLKEPKNTVAPSRCRLSLRESMRNGCSAQVSDPAGAIDRRSPAYRLR